MHAERIPRKYALAYVITPPLPNSAEPILFVAVHTNVIVVTIRISTADLIGGGGNTDVCPGGRQTPSRRHCPPDERWDYGSSGVYCLPFRASVELRSAHVDRRSHQPRRRSSQQTDRAAPALDSSGCKTSISRAGARRSPSVERFSDRSPRYCAASASRKRSRGGLVRGSLPRGLATCGRRRFADRLSSTLPQLSSLQRSTRWYTAVRDLHNSPIILYKVCIRRFILGGFCSLTAGTHTSSLSRNSRCSSVIVCCVVD